MDGQHRRKARLIRAAAFAAIGLASAAALAAEPYRLAPYKDDLFAYPSVLETRDDGAYVVVSYDKQRDLYGRDEVPERQAKWPYISNVRQQTVTYDAAGKPLKAIGVGKIEGGAHAVVIYIHGQGGTRAQGADNGMFGGNFNRIMNLMAKNDGAYLSPDFTDIGDTGTAEIKALVLDQAARSPNAAIFMACGSQGGVICWRLVADQDVAAHLAGLLLLGSTHDDAFLKSPQIKPKARRIPIYIGHGTADPIFAWQDEVAFYAKVRKAARDYPIHIALFDTGVHGTPIRMTDWRLVLNWMLEANGG
ncbi:MAG TPA: alpha/beta hydrolase [Bauldia sp.]|nr:alpha/beta hydrolase [Bauldia sp.]